MSELGWLSRSRTDVPPGAHWLGPREQEVLAGLRFPKRREDWLLGRWTGKLAVATWLETAPERVELVAAADGAPEAYVDGERAPVAISLSHRAGRGLAVVADRHVAVGCDLELLEPRSAAFVREWLTEAEQALISSAGDDHARVANLLWTAKEAAAKARREGLRLDVRRAVVDPGPVERNGAGWRPLLVTWGDGAKVGGWWRGEPHWVLAVTADPAPHEEPHVLGD